MKRPRAKKKKMKPPGRKPIHLEMESETVWGAEVNGCEELGEESF
jgi:hypothetical protein